MEAERSKRLPLMRLEIIYNKTEKKNKKDIIKPEAWNHSGEHGARHARRMLQHMHTLIQDENNISINIISGYFTAHKEKQIKCRILLTATYISSTHPKALSVSGSSFILNETFTHVGAMSSSRDWNRIICQYHILTQYWYDRKRKRLAVITMTKKKLSNAVRMIFSSTNYLGRPRLFLCDPRLFHKLG